MNDDKRREIRIAAQQVAHYSLTLLALVHRGLQVLDQADEPSAFRLDLEEMAAAAKILHGLIQSCCIYPVEGNIGVEMMIEETFSFGVRMSLLHRVLQSLPKDDSLHGVYDEMASSLTRISRELDFTRETLGIHAPRLVALERSMIEGISEEEAFELDAARWR